MLGLNEYEWWLLGTALLFTGLGFHFGLKTKLLPYTEYIVDDLIRKEFIQTRLNKDGEIELLKWYENIDESEDLS